MLAATTLAALMASTASTVDNINQAWGIDDFADPLDPQLLVTTAPAFNGTFKLSATLQHHMVLQRAPASAVVWGFAAAGTTVTTTFAGGKTITSTAGSDTVWRAKLPPTPASATPTTLSFKVRMLFLETRGHCWGAKYFSPQHCPLGGCRLCSN